MPERQSHEPQRDESSKRRHNAFVGQSNADQGTLHPLLRLQSMVGNAQADTLPVSYQASPARGAAVRSRERR